MSSDIPENKAVFSSSEVLFFRTNDASDLQVQIAYALANQEEMNEKSERAFEKLKTDYNWIAISKQYDALFKGLLPRK